MSYKYYAMQMMQCYSRRMRMIFRNLHRFVNAAKFNMFISTEKTQSMIVSKEPKKNQKD